MEEDIFAPEDLHQSDKEFVPAETEKVRSDCMFNLTKIYRNTDGNIELINIEHSDLKEITNPFSALGPLMSKSMEEWYKELQEYYKNNSGTQ